MKVIVTCGPSYEPIDEVRRITNSSTGELGVMLSDCLARRAHEVFCLKGTMATYPGAPQAGTLRLFNTNDGLARLLGEIATKHEIGAVFHAAALCDFKVRRATSADGKALMSPKISSRIPELTLHLEPARKIIGDLRDLFPHALIVGWKYELEGSPAHALDRAWQQARENRTDACVLNGAAWGMGFAFCEPENKIEKLPDKPRLCEFLAEWLESKS